MRLVVVVLFVAAMLVSALPVRSLQPESAASQADASDGASENLFNTSAGPAFTLPQWTDGSGWSSAEYYSTIQLADVDGDVSDELLARTPNGMTIHSWDATAGHWKSMSDSGPFPDSSGWGDAPEYYETIQTADVDGDGSAELIGRSSVGIDTYKWSGSGWTQLAVGAPAFDDGGSWNKEEFYSTIQTADIDGDGAAELLARGGNGIETYKWSGGAWTQVDTENPPWSDKEGWEQEEYYSTIQTGDIDGDGTAELLGRGASGMDTYKWSGSGWGSLKSDSPKFTDDKGWSKVEYYSTIQTGDIDGDGAAEMLARGVAGVYVYDWTGTAWSELINSSPGWSDDAGWNKAEYYSTIQTGDFNGDGAAELLARSSTAIESHAWNGSGWSTIETTDPALSDSHWKDAGNYSTIQMGDINGDGDDDLVARGLYGIRTWSFNQLTANAWDNPVSYGFTPFTDTQLDAYTYISTFLTLASGEDVRGQYTTDANTLKNYQDCLFTGTNDNQWNDWTALPTETCAALGNSTSITPPSGLTLQDWNTVAEQIYGELGSAQSVTDYFSDLLTLYAGIFTDNENILTSTAQTLYGEDMSEKKVSAALQNLFLAPFKLGPLGGPIVSAVTATASALISAGLSAANTDSFQGKWSEAQSEFTTLTEKNKDAINEGHAFVAGDAALLTFVAEQKTSGAWNPADPWVTRYTTSEGRKQFALWIFQTLSPAIWEINKVHFESDSSCSAPKDEVYNYYIGDNKNRDCYREMIEKGSGFPLIYKYASKDNLKTIRDAVSDDCTPTMSNSATWEYGSCTLGTSKEILYLNRGGWDFDTVELCEDCAPPSAALDVLPGSPTNTISLSQPGHVHVAIYGSATFDATTTVPGSLVFAGASSVGWWSDDDDWHPSKLRDLNGDGYLDVVAAFLNQDLALSPGDTTAILTGTTTAGDDFRLIAPVTVTQGP